MHPPPYNVAVICHLFAAYRVPVFTKLVENESDQLTFTIFYHPDSNEDILQANPHSSGAGRWRHIKSRRIFGRLFWQSGVLRLAWRRNFDALILTGDAYFLSTWVATALARIRGKKVFLWTHGVYGKESWLILKIRLAFYRLANGLLLYGNYASRLLIDLGFDPDRLYEVYNSLDYEQHQDVRRLISDEMILRKKKELFPANPDDPILIFVGRIKQRKQLEMLVEACHQLNRQQIGTNVLIVGSGEEQAQLENLAKKYSLEDRVVFYGPCYAEDQLGLLFTMSSLCVTPGDVGLTAIHALSYGVPVITHDDFTKQGPEFEAITAGKSGDFFRWGDVDSLVNVVRKWLDILRDSPSEAIRDDCTEVIDRFYNPDYQKQVICHAIKGVPAQTIPGISQYLDEQ